MTGTFQLILHKKADLGGTPLEQLNYPTLETQTEWLVHGFSFAKYLQELGPDAQKAINSKSSVDLALRDAFHKMRSLLDDNQGVDGRRSHIADVNRGRFWDHASGRRQLGCPCCSPQRHIRCSIANANN
jgi:hypothetical protein